MSGTVVVTAGTEPGPYVVRPRISDARISPSRPCARRSGTCRRPGARVLFELSEDARVSGTYRLVRGRGRASGTFTVSGERGSNSVRLASRALRPGRFLVTLRARDDAGNVSRAVRITFTVR